MHDLRVALCWDQISPYDYSEEQFSKLSDINDKLEEAISRSIKFNPIFKYYSFESFPDLYYAFFMPLLNKYANELFIYTPYVPKAKYTYLNPEVKSLLQRLTL